MSLGMAIFWLVIIVFVLLFIFFPEFRSLLSGFGRLFVRDMAKTPEGAEAVYMEKIDEAQEAYNKSTEALEEAAGNLKMYEKDLKNLERDLARVEKECESLVQAGKIEFAKIKSEERGSIVSDIERTKKYVEAYTEAKKTAEEAQHLHDLNLAKLKREKKEVIENMKTQKQLKNVYADIDEIRVNSGTDKLLETIREENKNLTISAVGAKAVHDNKLSTKIQKAEEEAKKVQSDEYLDSLMKKYNK